jgi:putative ABC transport system permease protein
MMILKIAARNVLRNRRRSLMTLGTLTVGAAATLIFGALLNFILLDFQTSTVRRVGHLTVFEKGFFNFGGGNPSEFGIRNYQSLITLIETNPRLAPLVRVVTPYQIVFGVAGNYNANLSKTFFGRGIVPADRANMRQWNDFGVDDGPPPQIPMQGPDSGFIGLGMAHILGLCKELSIPNCPDRPVHESLAPVVSSASSEPLPPLVLEAAAARRDERAASQRARPGAQIELLAATAAGTPNVVRLHVEHTDEQGVKELDDNYVQLQLPLAQQLAYGRDTPRVTGVTIQLKHSRDLQAAREALQSIFQANSLNLEVRDFVEMTPLYRQAIAFFAFLFGFLSVIIGVIVVFTVVNTMTMSVMERTPEIGTARALGVQRRSLAVQFLMEGTLLGIAGATLGLLVAIAIVTVINLSGMTWVPPTASGHVPFRLYLLGSAGLPGGVWLALVGLAAFASLWPARRAARMRVVDALRHV